MKPLSALMTFIFAGCVGIPEDIKPIGDFELEKYLGTWYEIARRVQSFERGSSRVTAQ